MRAYHRVILAVSLGGVVLLAGCSMGGIPVNYYLYLLIKDTGGDQFANPGGLIIRLANTNAASYDEELDLLISYENADEPGTITMEQVTITCSAEDVTCDLNLAECPVRVEAIEERRYNSVGQFQGSRNLSGVDGYLFIQGDYDCGGFIVYQFSESEAMAFAY